jgi:hypothetical protein
VNDAYLDHLAEGGERLARLHRDLLPADVDLGAEGACAWLNPYRSRAKAGSPHAITATIRNPYPRAARAWIAGVAPSGWTARAEPAQLDLAPGAEGTITLVVTPPTGERRRRARVAIDLAFDRLRLGQHAEALVDCEPA